MQKRLKVIKSFYSSDVHNGGPIKLKMVVFSKRMVGCCRSAKNQQQKQI